MLTLSTTTILKLLAIVLLSVVILSLTGIPPFLGTGNQVITSPAPVIPSAPIAAPPVTVVKPTIKEAESDSETSFLRPLLFLIFAVTGPVLCIPLSREVIRWGNLMSDLLILLALPFALTLLTYLSLEMSLASWIAAALGVSFGLVCLYCNWVILKRIDNKIHG